MHRALAAGLFGLLAMVACHSTASSPTDGSSDGGDDASPQTGSCACVIGQVSIPCGGAGCAQGVTYLCTETGDPIAAEACGPTDATVENSSCVPLCNGSTCGSDQCGGICKCATGVTCNADLTCGNGCDGVAGDVCLTDSDASSVCCGQGYLCLTQDGGASSCCAVAGAGHCATDTDCCDYPALRCGQTTHTCGGQ